MAGRVDLRRPAPQGAAGVTRVAWIVTLLCSALPAIVFTELTGSTPGWLPAAQLAALAIVLCASPFVPAIRPLRRFAVVMAALLVVLQVLPRVHLSWAALQSLLGGTAFDARMQGEQTAKLAAVAVMLGVLLLLGLRRRDFFLTPGDSTALIRPAPLLGFPRPDPWWRFGLIWGIGIASALALSLWLTRTPEPGDFSALLPMLPGILVYASVNAFTEEMTYRAPMLATLEPALGSTQALWQSATLFGVAHYFGTPGGLVGAGLSIFMGWILGKAMVETRGLLWAWGIHALSDVVIFTFLARSTSSRPER